jgi:hypothetical protein
MQMGESIMRLKIYIASIAVAFAFGVALTLLLTSKSPSPVRGFSEAEVQAKVGRHVKWKASRVSNDKFINTGMVAFSMVRDGERLLVIDWDKKLNGMKHRITQISPVEYEKIIVEDAQDGLPVSNDN